MKRCAIVGTAGSWVKTPWDDPTLEVWSLNDAYCSKDGRGKPMPRADRWFEIHPIDKMWFRPVSKTVIHADEVPAGHYVRPEGHLDWLKAQAATIPVYLQDEPPAGWPVNAKRFPIERVEAEFGTYWASGPSYMVALALLEGYEEIHVYGIHLSTQAEYLEQRPQFEHMLGIARGRGVKVVMADESPVMKHAWRYAYEPRPSQPVNPARQALKRELKEAQAKKAALLAELVNWPRFKSKATKLAELRRVEVVEMDVLQQLQRGAGMSTVAARVAA